MAIVRISKSEIKGLKPLATGYKIFGSDYSAQNGKCKYSDNGESIEGNIYKETSEQLEICWKGIHFCKMATECLEYYPFKPYHKFAKVKAYGEIRDDSIKSKCCCRIIEIVKVYDYYEFARILDKEIKKMKIKRNATIDVYGGKIIAASISCSGDRIGCSENVGKSYDVHTSANVDNSIHINNSLNIQNSKHVDMSRYIMNSAYIDSSDCIYDSEWCKFSHNISNSSNIISSKNVYNSYIIKRSRNIYACLNCENVLDSYGLNNCENLSFCLFCTDIKNKTNYIFNKKSTEQRVAELLEIFAYRKFRTCMPRFIDKINLEDSKSTIISNINVDAWKTIPKEMEEYIKSIPEFDENVWNKIIDKVGGEYELYSE